MYRTSTPTHSFTLPFRASELNWCLISYAQNGTVLLEKELEDCTLDDKTISFTLTQSETKQFSEGMYEVQVRCGRSVTESMASKIAYLTVNDVLNDAIMPEVGDD